MSEINKDALEAAALSLIPPVSSGNLQMDLRSAAKRCIQTYLSHILQGAEERVARAMFEDEMKASPKRDPEQTWKDEDLIWMSNARAAIAALLKSGS